jgi:hypothetical protein
MKVVNSTQVNIQHKTSVQYTFIVKELETRGMGIHIYKIKDERSFTRVMLNNIHSSTNSEKLK